MFRPLLFVYGTLSSACNNPSAQTLRSQSEFLCRASFQGRLFEVDGYPGAVLSRTPGERVWGELWKITGDAEALFELLDAYEECSPDFPEPHEYRRCRIEIEREDGRTLVAWTWLYNRPVDGLKPISCGDYREKE